MQTFEKETVNSHAEGGRGGAEDDEEEEGMPRGGQRVQCQQQ
jgi:hypothetical protein